MKDLGCKRMFGTTYRFSRDHLATATLKIDETAFL